MLRVRSILTGVAGTPWYSNLYFNGTLSTDAQAAVDAVYAMWVEYGNYMSPRISINIEPFVASLSPSTGQPTGGFTTTAPAASGGSAAGDLLPPATQALGTFNTGAYAGGRAIKGKIFLPGLTESASDQLGQVADTVRSGLVSALNNLITAAPELVVYSKKNGQVYTVGTATVAKDFAVLRSRRD